MISGKGGDLLGGGGGGGTDCRGKPNQKEIVMIGEAHFAEQVVEQKREREFREEKIAEEGISKEEIKALKKRTKGSSRSFILMIVLNSAIVCSHFVYDALHSDSASSSETHLVGCWMTITHYITL